MLPIPAADRKFWIHVPEGDDMGDLKGLVDELGVGDEEDDDEETTCQP
jgi:hypothetical protein